MASISLSRDGAVAVVTLSNPPLNLFQEASFAELGECLVEVARSDARALVWRSEGKLFTGGVDVNDFQSVAEAGPDRAGEFAAPLIEVVRRLELLDIPTLALVHGLCLTAGLEVSLGCDIIWAAESARFGLVEAVVGLTPGAGGTQRMAERAGPGRAREFVMSGALYDAATLERWNVVNRVLADDDLHAEGMRFAKQLASGPTRAHAATKRVVRAYLEGGVDTADTLTPGLFADLFATADLRNGIHSFLTAGPGKATFSGR
jgi:enoyl-CoA hydratase